ncbi:MAG: hypothetical protein ACXVLT_13910 [Flavisolibacter sp.]
MQPKEIISELMQFHSRIKDDPRIGPAHICLYLAILKCWFDNEGRQPVSVFAKNLMQSAKIFSVSTYHRAIKDLDAYGYIKYEPSYNPLLGSIIYICKQLHD